jgi:hypothetical protein
MPYFMASGLGPPSVQNMKLHIAHHGDRNGYVCS